MNATNTELSISDPIDKYQSRPRNVVLYGECGAGKSSLINLIMGEDVAQTSPDALGCTTSHIPYEVTIQGQCFRLWDTVGLNEGSYGAVPAAKAKKDLTDFLRALNQADGVHLLVYCIRGTRAAVALKNHKIFSSVIGDSRVPVVLVVTCLEDFRPVMASWWTKNEEKLKQYGIHFSGYACVTTLKDDPTDSPDIQERRTQSYQDVCRLIQDTCSPTPHRTWGTAKDRRNFLRNLLQKIARYMRAYS